MRSPGSYAAVVLAAAAAAVAACGLLAAGCGHAETFEGGVLRKGDLSVRFGPVPGSWSPIQVQGADVAFRDSGRMASILFDVRCHERDGDAPLSALTGHLIMGTTERDFEKQDTIPFDGREAMHTLMRAKLDGVPMQYDIFVMKKDGCVYDLVYVAPPDAFAQGADGFERFALGLRASSPGPSPTELGSSGP
jgi:hypothetical protein